MSVGLSSQESNKRAKSRVANLAGLLWDEFFLCDPGSEMNAERMSCPCGQCFEQDTDILEHSLQQKKKTASTAKCRAIPSQLVFFCQ